MKSISIFFSALLVSLCIGDCYMHIPRGHNNRLNEASANRNNANRMHDSQNNNRGGYNVGETNKQNGFGDNNNAFESKRETMYDYDNELGEQAIQFEEAFVAGSVMHHTHTIQHGCGNDKNLCQLAMDLMCDNYDVDDAGWTNDDGFEHKADGLRVQLRNGANTGTPDDPNNVGDSDNTYANNENNRRGRNEAEEWYAIGKQRDRNERLFTADQKLQGSSQIYTRQNPGGTRRGLELPEERDYDPWWYPSPWMPLARMVNNVTDCQTRIVPGLMEEKCHCVPDSVNTNDANNIVTLDETNCEATANANWKCESWTDKLWQTPLCIQNTWSQVNNLGNVQNTEDGGLPRTLEWNIPTLQDLETAGAKIYTMDEGSSQGTQYARCVMRLRYNMSTTDYDPLKTTSDCDQDSNNGVQSPVQQNPTVDVGLYMQGLRLALNTAQTGRTFQDRSHVFLIVEPPAELQTKAAANKITNVNVQGKRGNIVQTFPAVEYDYWPKKVELNTGDCLAFQWTGSNTHNNGNPAGDGQAGDAGEGRGGSDRHNMMQLMDESQTFPFPLDNPGDFADYVDFFQVSDCYRTVGGGAIQSGNANTPNDGTLNVKDAQVYLMSGGYYSGYNDIQGKEVLDVLLNNTPASMRGITCCPQRAGEWIFTNTRNNNFSNRDQKLRIKVTA